MKFCPSNTSINHFLFVSGCLEDALNTGSVLLKKEKKKGLFKPVCLLQYNLEDKRWKLWGEKPQDLQHFKLAGEETLSGKKICFVSNKNACKKIHDYVKTAIKIKSWGSPYKVWAHCHILFLKAGRYEVGKEELGLLNSQSPDI